MQTNNKDYLPTPVTGENIREFLLQSRFCAKRKCDTVLIKFERGIILTLSFFRMLNLVEFQIGTLLKQLFCSPNDLFLSLCRKPC